MDSWDVRRMVVAGEEAVQRGKKRGGGCIKPAQSDGGGVDVELMMMMMSDDDFAYCCLAIGQRLRLARPRLVCPDEGLRFLDGLLDRGERHSIFPHE